MEKIFSSKILKQFALQVFKELYSYDKFEKFSSSFKISHQDDGSIFLLVSDSQDSLNGLFITPYELMKKRNSPRQRWFETPFQIENTLTDNVQFFLSDQWYGDNRRNSTSIIPLTYFVNKYYANLFKIESQNNEYVLLGIKTGLIETAPTTISESQKKEKKTMQQIFFGAPGTGKSHKVNELVGEPKSFLVANDREARFGQFSQCGCAKANHYADVLSKQETFNQDVFAIDDLEELKSLLESCDGDDKVKNPRHSALRAYIDFVSQPTVFRTTFHPDYDYAQFVGSYKPKKNGAVITYDFVPQVFAKAYKRAKETGEPVYLVIEEINRGNCAQIFGDIFQLLDRNESGESQYEIDVDSDFAEWLGESKIKLPPNFNILATMNTSDQSLFPMDSAFKRRFDWEYVPISFEGKSAANFQIEIGSSENVKYYSWQTFVEKVNAKILDLTESEDKQLGEYFIQPDKKLNDSDTEKTVISEERFKGKVMFYLWNEICKDEHKNGSFFKIENDFFTFQDLYKDDSKLAAFMEEIEKTGKN